MESPSPHGVEPLLPPVAAVVPLLPPSAVVPLLPPPVPGAITEEYIFLHTKLSTPTGHIYPTPTAANFAGIQVDRTGLELLNVSPGFEVFPAFAGDKVLRKRWLILHFSEVHLSALIFERMLQTCDLVGVGVTAGMCSAVVRRVVLGRTHRTSAGTAGALQHVHLALPASGLLGLVLAGPLGPLLQGVPARLAALLNCRVCGLLRERPLSWPHLFGRLPHGQLLTILNFGRGRGRPNRVRATLLQIIIGSYGV